MVVGIRDTAKLLGIAIISFCAVLVCTMFLNFYLDVLPLESRITTELSMVFYRAQLTTAKVVCLVSGGCLLLTSVVTLFFYIKHYIDTHKKELGILKALGYSNFRIAGNFWVFGSSVLTGTVLGFAGAFLLMPGFYRLQNEDKMLPDYSIHFHFSVFFYFVILPTLAFALLAVLYAFFKLKMPTLSLLRDSFQETGRAKKHRPDRESGEPFLRDLKKSTLKSRKALVFFIFFAAFCFSAMTQMAFSMKDLASEMMGIMILLIGLTLAFTTLLLAIATVIRGNTKTIAMMRVFGYSQKECCRALLDGYRPVSYIGFILGTVYQYALLRVMVDIVFREVGNAVPVVYQFDVPMMCLSLVVFLGTYEIVMHIYAEKIKKISVKEIMLE